MMYLQSSMLFLHDPAFIPSSKLESGFLRVYDGSNRQELMFCNHYIEGLLSQSGSHEDCSGSHDQKAATYS